MTKLAGQLMGVNDAGKVPNRSVAKSKIVFLLPINNVGRTLLLGLPPNKMAAPLDILRF